MICLALELRGHLQQPQANVESEQAAHDQVSAWEVGCVHYNRTPSTLFVLDLPLGRLGYHLGAFLGNIDVDERGSIVILEERVACQMVD
jgi:hypothetical protein